MAKTTVVNMSTYSAPFGRVPIDRCSPFGNPYNIGPDGTREQVIEKYREYFYDRLTKDPCFKAIVHRLRGCALGCRCKPLPCHGDVIAEYLNNLEI
jgi:hypothetical protein